MVLRVSQKPMPCSKACVEKWFGYPASLPNIVPSSGRDLPCFVALGIHSDAESQPAEVSLLAQVPQDSL